MNRQLQILAAQLAAKHREPNEVVPHPKVVVRNYDGTIDQFMIDKLGDDKYVPYCFGNGCGRTRRKPWGFQCPTCANKMNWDLTRFNGNANVEHIGPKPALDIKTWNINVAAKKQAKLAAKVAKQTT